ncbi:MAG: DUF3179 domain-containing protein [Deltaproteobacteria bacterium]|nr:DUF3179 domain-containing protein [Deltaproteobacteria bacterium]
MARKTKSYSDLVSGCTGKDTALLIALVVAMSFAATHGTAFSSVIEEGGKTYIMDRTGERWDVTQAGSIGFSPEGFQYGIGRNTIPPLDNSHFSFGPYRVPEDLRVIGVTEGPAVQAYSVPNLTRHEIANTEIGGKKIAVGY